MMSLSSKQPFGLPHGGGGGGGGGLHETKYSALHSASPCPSAAAPAASSPGGTGSGGTAGRGSGSGSGGGGSGSGSGSGSGGGAEAMRRGCLPAPPVGARRPPPALREPPAAPRPLMIFSWPRSESPGPSGACAAPAARMNFDDPGAAWPGAAARPCARS